MRHSHASTIRFSLLLARTVFALPTLRPRDDVSHPDSERELVLRGGLGVETRELGDELVCRSVDRYLRISPLWRLAL